VRDGEVGFLGQLFEGKAGPDPFVVEALGNRDERRF
jgi:hypothetical protein